MRTNTLSLFSISRCLRDFKVGPDLHLRVPHRSADDATAKLSSHEGTHYVSSHEGTHYVAFGSADPANFRTDQNANSSRTNVRSDIRAEQSTDHFSDIRAEQSTDHFSECSSDKGADCDAECKPTQ